MASRNRTAILPVLMSASLMLAPGAAWARANPFVPQGDVADAPSGFSEMCARDMRACEPTGVAHVADPGARAPVAGRAPDACAAAEPAIAHAPRWPGMAIMIPSFVSGIETGALATCAPQEARPEGLGSYFTTAAMDRTPAGGPAVVRPASRDTLMELAKRINAKVNRNVIQRSDLATYGVEEYWRPAGGARGAVGDCEDIALEKRDELLAAGAPSDRLMLATAFVRGFGLHTVLIVRMTDGDYVLDSLAASVSRWDKVRYSWLRVQDPRDPLAWRLMRS